MIFHDRRFDRMPDSTVGRFLSMGLAGIGRHVSELFSWPGWSIRRYGKA
jgi:hypothetical protein